MGIAYSLSKADWGRLMNSTKNYSGSDLKSLVINAARGPLQNATPEQLGSISSEKLDLSDISNVINVLWWKQNWIGVSIGGAGVILFIILLIYCVCCCQKKPEPNLPIPMVQPRFNRFGHP